MQHSTQEQGAVQENSDLAMRYYREYKSLSEQSKKYESWDALGRAVKYGYNSVKTISDVGYMVADEIEIEARRLYNGYEEGKVKHQFFSEAYELTTRYLIFDACIIQKPLQDLRKSCLEIMSKNRAKYERWNACATSEDFPSLYKRILSCNFGVRYVIDEEKRQMNRLRESLIPRFKQELLQTIPAKCEAAKTHADYQEIHKLCEEAKKAVPEVPFFQALPLYVQFRSELEIQDKQSPNIVEALEDICDVDADIKFIVQDCMVRNHVLKEEKNIDIALGNNKIDEARARMAKLIEIEKSLNQGHNLKPDTAVYERCMIKLGKHMQLEFLQAHKKGDVKLMEELVGPNRLAPFPGVQAECRKMLNEHLEELKTVKETARRIALDVLERCRNNVKFKSNKDNQNYESLTTSLHQAILTSKLNQGDRDRFLIDFRRYVNQHRTPQNNPYKDVSLVNDFINALVKKLNSEGCFEVSTKWKKEVLTVTPKQFSATGVESVIASYTDRFQPDKESRTSNSHVDTDSSAHSSSGESSPTRSHSPVEQAKATVPKAERRITAPPIPPLGGLGQSSLFTQQMNHNNKNGNPAPSAPPLSPSTEVFGY